MKSQVRAQILTIEAKIAKAIMDRVATLRQVKYVSHDRVLISIDDLNEIQTPAVQFIDQVARYESEKSRDKIRWEISLEVILKATQYQPASQVELWALCSAVRKVIGSAPGLGIPGMIHITQSTREPNINLIDPFYIARLDFEVLYYDSYTGLC